MAEDGEWEDESLIVVELSGIIEQDWIQNIGDKCKIVGLDTDEPLLQIDRYVFSGNHKDTDGTDVIFEFPSQSDCDAGQPKLRYKCHTFKKLCMQRAFLTAKEDESKSAATEDSTTVEVAKEDESKSTTAASTIVEVASACAEGEQSDAMDTAACVETNSTESVAKDSTIEQTLGEDIVRQGGAAEKEIESLRTCAEEVVMEES